MRAEYVAEYGRLYREHWWWRSREVIVGDVVGGLGLRRPAEILDVGCGPGWLWPRLERWGRVRGIEVDEGMLGDGGGNRERIQTRPLGDPWYEEAGWRFDLIVALDVLEHIEDDQTAARALAGMLRPGGWLVVTVPAFGVLWDRHDEINEHWRRYTVGGVRGLLEGVGLRVERARYLYRLLFAPKWVVARWNRWWGRGRPVAQHGVPPGVWNRLLEWVCVGEDRLLRGLPVPFGTSALAVARRAWE